MNIVGIQLGTVWEDKAANHRWLADHLSAHPPEPGTLVVLPEMWATGFSMNVAGITETPDNETGAFLADLAATYQIGLLAGVVTTGADGLGRNQAVLFGTDGGELARYTKMHPFSFGTETTYYERGSEVVLFEWLGVTVAPFICYDLRFPEIFRDAVRHGAELLCVLANWPQVREDHWRTLLKARAIENQAYVIGVNRVGDDPHLTYFGGSLIYSPRGEVLADGGSESGQIAAALDLESLREYRRTFLVLADIHPNYR